jgi:3-deoxy-7-phosphoheptulonate synthase
MPAPWSPSSWQSKTALQQPSYEDATGLKRVLDELATMPPLVTSWEIEALKSQLADAAAGRRFLLQGGDCCETFDDCTPDAITSKLKILLQMSLVLVHGTHKPVIRVGRFAGQYAKPRTSDVEEKSTSQQVNKSKGEVDAPSTLPVYRGDLVNRIDFTPEARRADPVNLLRAYSRSALTLNFIRALIDGGFADLHHPEYWDLGFVPLAGGGRAGEYQQIVREIGESLRFMETLAGQTVAEMTRVNFYTSHEALHLPYEQAQTRQVPRREGWYNLGTHFPWIGMRTSDPDGAHIEYARGIRNPIAVKIGPASPQEKETDTRRRIARLIETLNPDNEPGRLTFIHRFGAKDIGKHLPVLIEAVQASAAHRQSSTLFVCDPMHGNTQSVQVGGAGKATKTRSFDHILVELEQAFEIHKSRGSILGGVHFELTGENVTECTGGARNVSEADLSRAYRSQVDPRLNYEQSLEMAMRIAKRAE